MIDRLSGYFKLEPFLNVRDIIEFDIEINADKDIFSGKIGGNNAFESHNDN